MLYWDFQSKMYIYIHTLTSVIYLHAKKKFFIVRTIWAPIDK